MNIKEYNNLAVIYSSSSAIQYLEDWQQLIVGGDYYWIGDDETSDSIEELLTLKKEWWKLHDKRTI